jgi:hypothetical protein
VQRSVRITKLEGFRCRKKCGVQTELQLFQALRTAASGSIPSTLVQPLRWEQPNEDSHPTRTIPDSARHRSKAISLGSKAISLLLSKNQSGIDSRNSLPRSSVRWVMRASNCFVSAEMIRIPNPLLLLMSNPSGRRCRRLARIRAQSSAPVGRGGPKFAHPNDPQKHTWPSW